MRRSISNIIVLVVLLTLSCSEKKPEITDGGSEDGGFLDGSCYGCFYFCEDNSVWFDDNEGNIDLIEKCDSDEYCVDHPAGSICCSEEPVRKCTGSGAVQWFDGCEGNEMDEYEECTAPNMICYTLSTTDAECRCADNFTGEDCQECAGELTGEMCDQCTGNRDPDELCEECLEGWTGEDCEIPVSLDAGIDGGTDAGMDASKDAEPDV